MVVGDMNARLGDRLPGEDLIIGPHTFGNQAARQVEVPNRDLMMQFCESNTLSIANTFMDTPPEQKVTYMEPGATYMGPVCDELYNMLDIFLCDGTAFNQCSEILSIREAALATDHYLVRSVFTFDAQPAAPKARPKLNVAALESESCKSDFIRAFNNTVHGVPADYNISQYWATTRTAMKNACQALPTAPEATNNPWISASTLDLIRQRRLARAANDYDNEKILHQQVRASAKKDRTEWLDKMLQDGNWTQVRKLRRPRRAKCCKLQGQDGEFVESDKWADTMADHLEFIQWRVRPPGIVAGPPLGPILPVVLAEFTKAEVKAILKKLKNDRASGPDDIPAKLWKTLGDTDDGLAWITELVNKCWREEHLPDDWHLANVTAIHKKGPLENAKMTVQSA